MEKHTRHGLTVALIGVAILALSGCTQQVSADASVTQEISSQPSENMTLAFVDEDESTEDAQNETTEKTAGNTVAETTRQTDTQTKKQTTGHSSTNSVAQKIKTKEKSKQKKKKRAEKSDNNAKETPPTDSEQQPVSEQTTEKDVLTSTTQREHTVSEKKGEWGATG